MSQVRKALLIEPHHDKTCLEFLTRSDTNRAVQPQKMARGLAAATVLIEFTFGTFGSLKILEF